MSLRRIVMIRHGETEGESSIRYHGSGDVPLSDEGRRQIRHSAREVAHEPFDLILSSPLRRAFEGAQLLAGGAAIRLEPDFREVDFGRWEGMTAEEIQASDPVLYQEWQSGAEGFLFPGGESRVDFRERILRGLERLRQGTESHVLLISHKGVIGAIAEALSGERLEAGPTLGGVVSLSRGSNGQWHLGRRGATGPGIDDSGA
jgi:broad specificity phosphatase PhoE